MACSSQRGPRTKNNPLVTLHMTNQFLTEERDACDSLDFLKMQASRYCCHILAHRNSAMALIRCLNSAGLDSDVLFVLSRGVRLVDQLVHNYDLGYYIAHELASLENDSGQIIEEEEVLCSE